MIIGIDIRSACGEKAGMGTHFYELVHYLGKIDRENRYLLYARVDFEAADQLPQNMTVVKINLPLLLWHPAVAFHARLRQVQVFLTYSNITVLILKRNQSMLCIPDVSGIVLARYHTFKVFVLSKLYYLAIQRSAAIITVSQYSKRAICRCLKVNPERIFVTTEAASLDFRVIENHEILEKWKRSLKLPERFILFVGSVEPRKNIMGLLKALLQIESGLRPKLVVAGGRGWKNSEVFRFLRENSLGDGVNFLGYISREALVALYNMADAFVFPTIYEGFGLPVLEAMACGTPVVSSNATSLPEIADDAALLVDPYDTAALSKAICRVITDQTLRKEMRQKGLTNAAKYSWLRTAKETLLIFSSQSNSNRQ